MKVSMPRVKCLAMNDCSKRWKIWLIFPQTRLASSYSTPFRSSQRDTSNLMIKPLSSLKEFFQQMSADPTPRIVINLSDVNFIDSTGLATLTIGMQLCRQQHGDLVLCGIQQPVNVIFEVTRLDKVFTISATEEAAITKMKNP